MKSIDESSSELIDENEIDGDMKDDDEEAVILGLWEQSFIVGNTVLIVQ